MRTKNLSITLPVSLLKIVDTASRTEHRTRSEFIREALRHYLLKNKELPASTATREEIRALEAGRREHARGEYVTLDALIHELDTAHRHAR